MSTSKDVAALAGVSPATVSRVFRGEAVVKEQTRAAVLAAAHKLNYTPNLAASMLKRQTNRTVAFLNPDAGNPFYIQLISQISDVLREAHGYTTIMVPDTKYEHRMVESIRFFLSYHVQCIVFSPINSAVDPRLERLIEKEKSCKFLQLHCKVYPHVSAVHYDDVLGMEIATEHLLRRGHRRILIVSDDAPRIRGCTAAYRKAGIETPAIPVEALPSDVSAEQVVRLVERHRPTAIIAVAEYFGLVTFSALTQLRMRIPEDISLIVYDDTPWTRAMGISVMTHDDQAVVENAVDSILGMIDGRYTAVRDRMVPPYLLPRTSVLDLRTRENGEAGHALP